jgi:hypothetical protein
VIPMSSEDKEALTKLNDLSAAEIKNFLSRKTKYIEKIAKTLALFSMQPQAINKVITLLNNQLFKNAKLVARANATAATIGIGISGGIGFSDWLATQLRKAPMLKNLPKSSGFYFQLSVGLCVMQTQKFGKTKLAFQPVFEFRRAEKILAAFVGIGVGGGFSLSIEAPNPDDVQTARFFKFSSYNVTSSDTTLSIGLGTGIGLGLTKFAVMEGKATAFRADREGLKLLMNYLGNSFFSRANKCSDVFSMSLLSSRLPSPLDWSY